MRRQRRTEGRTDRRSAQVRIQSLARSAHVRRREPINPIVSPPAKLPRLSAIYSDMMSQGKRFFPGLARRLRNRRPQRPERLDRARQINGANGPGVWTRYARNLSAIHGVSGEGPQATRSAVSISTRTCRARRSRRQILERHRHRSVRVSQQPRRKAHHVFRLGRPAIESADGRRILRKGGGTDGRRDRRISSGCSWCPACSTAAAASEPACSTPRRRCSIGWNPATPRNRSPAAAWSDGKVVRTRPLCPYPQVARYKGSGSIDDAANFSCAAR